MTYSRILEMLNEKFQYDSALGSYVENGVCVDEFGRPLFKNPSDSAEFMERGERRKKQEKANLRQIRLRPEFILDVEKPTHNEIALACLLKPEVAGGLRDIPEEIQNEMVESDYHNLAYIKHPTFGIAKRVHDVDARFVESLKYIPFIARLFMRKALF